MHSHIALAGSPFFQRRARRRRATAVRYTLLTPPSRLTIDEAAALLRLPRRAVETELEWLAPGASDEPTSERPGIREVRA
ncbi:hypothetical protein [Luteitalea sp.]|uniref:hypothetical protein n=1 Tax=Luteitalea sp. TaxID=2004800 RepID=UPI0025C63AC1|nr:hypothetical protein [Luteitalea sp.]